MTIDQIKEKFINNPKFLGQGAGWLAKNWKCSKEDVHKAKQEVKALVKNPRYTSPAKTNSIEPVYIGSSEDSAGSLKKYDSSLPLSSEQIQTLVKVDGINTKIDKVIERLQSNGTWSYDIHIKYNKVAPYTANELKSKLKELFPDITPQSLPVVKREGEKALVILVSDDHAGAVNGQSMFGNEWSGSTYAKRLLEISNEAKEIGYKFEEVHIISLGDQLNGFNQQTTRGGHEVRSVSNKEQFDIYTTARRIFYDDLFQSGIGERFYVHDIENSNHSGNDFSYMANKLLEIWLEAKYPTVRRQSYFLPINTIHYGIHTIGFGHGKDEKLMFKPMPLKLDAKTDLLLFQYFDKNGISPSDRRITMYKGDLHSYAMDKGKFGRYINVPSVMGSTDYTEINFGHTEPGAILEVFSKGSKMIQHIPLWF